MDIKKLCKQSYPKKLKKCYKTIPLDKQNEWLFEEAILNIKANKEIGFLNILLND